MRQDLRPRSSSSSGKRRVAAAMQAARRTDYPSRRLLQRRLMHPPRQRRRRPQKLQRRGSSSSSSSSRPSARAWRCASEGGARARALPAPTPFAHAQFQGRCKPQLLPRQRRSERPWHGCQQGSAERAMRCARSSLSVAKAMGLWIVPVPQTPGQSAPFLRRRGERGGASAPSVDGELLLRPSRAPGALTRCSSRRPPRPGGGGSRGGPARRWRRWGCRPWRRPGPPGAGRPPSSCHKQ